MDPACVSCWNSLAPLGLTIGTHFRLRNNTRFLSLIDLELKFEIAVYFLNLWYLNPCGCFSVFAAKCLSGRTLVSDTWTRVWGICGLALIEASGTNCSESELLFSVGVPGFLVDSVGACSPKSWLSELVPNVFYFQYHFHSPLKSLSLPFCSQEVFLLELH